MKYLTFFIISFDGDQNIKKKMTAIKTKSFLPLVVDHKGFSLDNAKTIWCTPKSLP
jgi:hypothetical protein